jgi:hypothetical protein
MKLPPMLFLSIDRKVRRPILSIFKISLLITLGFVIAFDFNQFIRVIIYILIAMLARF